MPITLTGTGTITGISAGGLPDGSIAKADLSATGTADATTFLRGDNTWAAAGGGAWNVIGTAVASNSASLTITGLDSTYDTYGIGISDIVPATDDAVFYMRLGDSSGVDSGGSDYEFHCASVTSDSASYGSTTTTAQNSIQFTNQGVGNQANEGTGAMLYLARPADGTMWPNLTGTYTQVGATTNLYGGFIVAVRRSAISVDRINISFNTGNIASGRMTVWGIAHA